MNNRNKRLSMSDIILHFLNDIITKFKKDNFNNKIYPIVVHLL